MDRPVLDRFLNHEQQVAQWPAKHSHKLLVLEYLVTKFELDRSYHENEVNQVLKQWHTFSDWPLLRRSLVESKLMGRNRDGTEYRRSA